MFGSHKKQKDKDAFTGPKFNIELQIQFREFYSDWTQDQLAKLISAVFENHQVAVIQAETVVFKEQLT